MKRLPFAALCAIALLTVIGGTGCEATRRAQVAREEQEQRALWGDGYEQAREEYEAARYVAWVLSWRNGPPGRPE